MLRIILFSLLGLSIFNQFYLVAMFLFLWYLLVYTGYELVILAILLDGYYGAFYAVPVLTLVTFLVWIATLTTKRMLLLYTDKNEFISQKTP